MDLRDLTMLLRKRRIKIDKTRNTESSLWSISRMYSRVSSRISVFIIWNYSRLPHSGFNCAVNINQYVFNSRRKISRLVSLWIEVLFYSVGF